MFVTAENFANRPYKLVNLDDADIAAEFAAFIDKEEADMLERILGGDLYDAFVAGLAALPPVWAQATEYHLNDQVSYGVAIWDSLGDSQGVVPVEGASWHKVEDNRWLMLKNGARYSHFTNNYRWHGMVEMLTPLIFSRWTECTFDSETGQGVVTVESENADQRSPSRRIALAWNDFSRLAGAWCEWRNTLYGYLYNNLGLYEIDQQYLRCMTEAPGRKNTFNL